MARRCASRPPHLLPTSVDVKTCRVHPSNFWLHGTLLQGTPRSTIMTTKAHEAPIEPSSPYQPQSQHPFQQLHHSGVNSALLSAWPQGSHHQRIIEWSSNHHWTIITKHSHELGQTPVARTPGSHGLKDQFLIRRKLSTGRQAVSLPNETNNMENTRTLDTKRHWWKKNVDKIW